MSVLEVEEPKEGKGDESGREGSSGRDRTDQAPRSGREVLVRFCEGDPERVKESGDKGGKFFLVKEEMRI